MNTPLQVFCDNNEWILNDSAIIVCEHEGTWHQVIFPEGKAIIKQSAEFIHQYDISNETTEASVAKLAVLLDQKARISPASQTILLYTPTTPTNLTQDPTMTTTTTKATTSTTIMAATTTTPNDIKKVFGKALKQKDLGGGGGGGGGGGDGGGKGRNAPQPQQAILPA